MDTTEMAGLLVDMAEILIVISLFIFFRIKFVLQEKGYEVAWFDLSRTQFSDYPNLKSAIKTETDDSELRKFTFYKRLNELLWVLFPLAIVLMFIGLV